MRQHKQSNTKTLWGGGNSLAFIFTCGNPIYLCYTGSRGQHLN